MSPIHSTAVVDPRARLDPTATIGPFCVVGGAVTLAAGVRIGAHAVLEGDVRIGEAATIGEGVLIRGTALIGARAAVFPYCVLGQVGQFPGRHQGDGRVVVGDDVTLREFVIINKPVTSAATIVGDGCYLMARTQVDHDCRLDPFVKTATGVTLGGAVHIEDHAYLGMNAVVHQGLRIGRACMIGMNGVVTAHVPPFTVLVDRRVVRVNAVGLARLGASDTEIAAIEHYYRAIAEGRDPEASADAWRAAIAHFLEAVAPGRVAPLAFAKP